MEGYDIPADSQAAVLRPESSPKEFFEPRNTRNTRKIRTLPRKAFRFRVFCVFRGCLCFLASSGIFRCFFIGYHRSCLPALMDRQRPSPLQTRCKSPNSPMRKGVRLQIKRAGGRALSLSSRPPAVERRKPPMNLGSCLAVAHNMFIFSHIENTGEFRKNRFLYWHGF